MLRTIVRRKAMGKGGGATKCKQSMGLLHFRDSLRPLQVALGRGPIRRMSVPLGAQRARSFFAPCPFSVGM